jgi:hypothetical protein
VARAFRLTQLPMLFKIPLLPFSIHLPLSIHPLSHSVTAARNRHYEERTPENAERTEHELSKCGHGVHNLPFFLQG